MKRNDPTQPLFHISDRPRIRRFIPRPVPPGRAGLPAAVVWAIDKAHLPNYLLPRDSPRISFFVREGTSAADIDRFFGLSTAARIIAVEKEWLTRILRQPLFLYEFDRGPFILQDEIAGYYVATEPVVPLRERHITNPLQELLTHDVELRLMSNLWGLHDAVAGSTLGFSMIRMRSAAPRAENRPVEPYRPG